jgi:hypothetical protein
VRRGLTSRVPTCWADARERRAARAARVERVIVMCVCKCDVRKERTDEMLLLAAREGDTRSYI